MELLMTPKKQRKVGSHCGAWSKTLGFHGSTWIYPQTARRQHWGETEIGTSTVPLKSTEPSTYLWTLLRLAGRVFKRSFFKEQRWYDQPCTSESTCTWPLRATLSNNFDLPFAHLQSLSVGDHFPLSIFGVGQRLTPCWSPVNPGWDQLVFFGAVISHGFKPKIKDTTDGGIIIHWNNHWNGCVWK